MSRGFRCAAASLDRDESLIGTASTVRAFVLVEFPGSWGREALRDARLPAPVRDHLTQLSRLGVKTLLVRRHGRPTSSARRHVFVAWAGRGASWLESTLLRSIDEVVDLDLSPVSRGGRPGLDPLAEPLICVCTHGRHDTCCAELGRPLAAALSATHPSLVWEVSHVGGDRFAGNVVILPDGLYYGRVPPGHGPRLAEDHLAGRLDLDYLRGRTSSPFAAQAAEILLRKRLGEPGLDAVSLVAAGREDDLWTVELDVRGERWQCTLTAGRSEPAQLTCAVSRLARPPAFRAVSIERVA